MRDGGRGLRHRITALGILWESDDFTDAFCSDHDGQQTVQSCKGGLIRIRKEKVVGVLITDGDSTVRGATVLQCLQ